MRRLALLFLTCAAATGFGHPVAAQDRRDRDVRVFRTFDLDSRDADRAAIGVTTASAGARDTLGAVVESVTPGGPADKAGIKDGEYITAINGTSLRAPREDAGDEEMGGIGARRLVREMRKVKPGSEVELRVLGNGKARTVKVKTVAARDLARERFAGMRATWESRPVLGLSLGEQTSRRDTLGVFVTSVTPDGPAEKAGIVEGDRIAAINGTNLRAPREDAGQDPMNVAARRFHRVLRNVKVGDRVELRVYSGGQYKTVRVTAAKLSDVMKNRPGFGFMMGEEGMDMMPMPGPHNHMMVMPAPPAPPGPPGPAPSIRALPDAGMDFEFVPDVPDVSDAIDRATRRAAVELRRTEAELRRAGPQPRVLRRQVAGEIAI